MNLLLDTHALIWLAEADDNLSVAAKAAIESPLNTCFVSVSRSQALLGNAYLQALLDVSTTPSEASLGKRKSPKNIT